MAEHPQWGVEDVPDEYTDPETGWDVRMAKRMAKSILMAHDANPESWALITAQSRPGVPFLNVGGTNACAFYQLAVVREEAEGIDPEFVASHDMEKTYTSDENQGLMVLEFAPNEVPNALPRFEKAHEVAVRRMTVFSSPRKPEHRDDLRNHLERITGLEIPAPNYYSRVGGDGLTDSDDDSPRSVDDSLDLAPWPQDALIHIARTILRAHDRSAGSWALRMRNEEITLYINRPKFIACSRTHVHLLVAGHADVFNIDLPGAIQLSKGRSFQYPSIWIANIQAAQFSDVYQLIRDAHDEIFDQLAPTPGTAVRINRSQEHDQALVESLSKHLSIDLPTPDYWTAEPLGRRTSEPSTPVHWEGSATITGRLASAGLTFTQSQIAAFYTALQTKGFVVLSGISGTGKSKIAQHFVKMLPTPSPEALLPLRPGNVMSFLTNPDQNWAAVSASQAELFPPVPVDYKHSVVYEFGGDSYTGFAVTKVLALGKPTLYLTLGDELVEKLRERNPQQTVYATTTMARSGDKIATVRLAFDPHELVGDTEPVVTTEASNSLFLAVRPDWRDSTSLLGYYNPLTETYEWTDFLRFLLRAVDDYDAYTKKRTTEALAWFVILDEMNLAHVEYYFADLLSIIESGRDTEGWSQEAIRLTYPDGLADAPPHQIKLPPNLYIIGTVNMDETTHAFSPKVLDRAFTIELTDVDFTDYPPETPATTGPGLPDEERQALLRAFTNDGTFAQVRKEDIRQAVDDHPEIRDWLQNLNERLAIHQFHFGYRVFDEIAQFVYHADRNGMFDDWVTAFDHAVSMKVLPKFNGSHARLHGPLEELIIWARNPAKNARTGILIGPEDDAESEPDRLPTPVTAPALPRVRDRAQRMMEMLEANGFVSFG